MATIPPRVDEDRALAEGSPAQQQQSDTTTQFSALSDRGHDVQRMEDQRPPTAEPRTHWPAQAWFQQLLEVALCVETHELARVAVPPASLGGSARTALSGVMLSFIRVAGRPVGCTGNPLRAAARA